MSTLKDEQLLKLKRALCVAALAEFDKVTPELQRLNRIGLCGRLSYSNAGEISSYPYWELLRDLKRHLGEPDDAWSNKYCKHLPDPKTAEGQKQRKALLELAVKHYTSKLKYERAYLENQNQPFNNGR